MFDILLFLYDNLMVDLYPDPEALSRKLLAAGFEDAEIDQALGWLSALDGLQPGAEAELAPAGMRCYGAEERARLDVAGIGFLMHLEQAGLLPPHAREWVIGQAMALEEGEVSADKVKWIALLAIARLYGPGDALWLEDLARGGEDDWRPTLH